MHFCCRYFSYFHSIMTYGIIFWGTSLRSSIIFRLQKRALPLQSQYTLSLLLFVVDNRERFRVNSEIHHINTRYRSNLHPPITHLSVYQKGAHYSGIKVFDSLPTHIKELSHNRNHFKRALKIFFYTHFIP